MNSQQLLQRLKQLQEEGKAIMEQLVAAGLDPQQIIGSLQNNGMGNGPGPDRPPRRQPMPRQGGGGLLGNVR